MRKLLLILLLLLLAVGIGWGIHSDSGNVLITFRDRQIETSLWLAVLLLLSIFIVGYGLIRFLISSSRWPKRWRQWRQAERQRRAEQSAELALCDLLEENNAAAEQYFNKAAAHIRRPLLHYIGAAMAAQAQGKYLERDNYLQKAYHAAPNAQISLGILQAKLQIQAQQQSQALDTLKQLQYAIPQHPVVTALAGKLTKTSLI